MRTSGPARLDQLFCECLHARNLHLMKVSSMKEPMGVRCELASPYVSPLPQTLVAAKPPQSKLLADWA